MSVSTRERYGTQLQLTAPGSAHTINQAKAGGATAW